MAKATGRERSGEVHTCLKRLQIMKGVACESTCAQESWGSLRVHILGLSHFGLVKFFYSAGVLRPQFFIIKLISVFNMATPV